MNHTNTLEKTMSTVINTTASPGKSSMPYRRNRVRKLVLAAMAVLVASCSLFEKPLPPPRVNVVPILRRNIEVYADASGNIEAVNITEVKSKASGQVLALNAETGTHYNAGDTLVQIDTKEVDSQVKQAELDTTFAHQDYQNALKERARQDSLFKARAIPRKEYDAGELTVLRVESNLAKARNTLDQAKQRQSDATVLAPISGTVIARQVQLGQIVTSSTSGVSAGTTLLTMTDLSQLRVRASFNEVDIANIDTGMTAMIMVDALPDQQIPGTISKIEPIAVTTNSVTMFPAIITIDNSAGKLRPGMNGAIQVWVERRENAIAVPNEAIRQTQEVPFLAEVIASLTGLPVDADSLKDVVDDQITLLGRTTFASSPNANIQSGDAPNAATTSNDPPGGGNQPGGGQRGGGQGGDQQGGGQAGGGNRAGGGGGGGPITAEQCVPVKTAFAKVPGTQKEYEGLIAKLRDPQIDRTKTNSELRALYTKAGADVELAARCQNLDAGTVARGARGTGGGGARGAGGARGGARGAGGARGGGGGGARGGRGQTGAAPPGATFGRNRNTITRNGLVFVVTSPGVYEARVIKTGLGSYEFTEVVEGLREGENVAILSAAIIALQQAQAREKMKGGAGSILGGGGANPGMGGGAGRGGGNPPGGGGGAPRGGGGGGGGGGGRGG